MINLDDRNIIEQIDTEKQLEILSQWSALFKEARKNSLGLVIPKKYSWKNKNVNYTTPQNIVICGMGVTNLPPQSRT